MWFLRQRVQYIYWVGKNSPLFAFLGFPKRQAGLPINTLSGSPPMQNLIASLLFVGAVFSTTVLFDTAGAVAFSVSSGNPLPERYVEFADRVTALDAVLESVVGGHVTNVALALNDLSSARENVRSRTSQTAEPLLALYNTPSGTSFFSGRGSSGGVPNQTLEERRQILLKLIADFEARLRELRSRSGSASATIDAASLRSVSANPVLSGTARNVQRPFGISLGQGDKVWGSGDIPVVNGKWSVAVDTPLQSGSYQVDVYSNNVRLATGTLTVTLAPTFVTPPGISLLSNTINLSQIPEVNGVSTSTVEAVFQIKAKTGDTPVTFAKDAFGFSVYRERGLYTGALVSDFSFIPPSSDAVHIDIPNGQFTLLENREIVFPVTFKFEGRLRSGVPLLRGNYSVGLQSVTWLYPKEGVGRISFEGQQGERTSSVFLFDAPVPSSPAPSTSDTLTAAPLRGGAPLTVQFSATTNARRSCSQQDYRLDFGDGSAWQALVVPNDACTPRTFSVSHFYAKAGLYTARLVTGNTDVAQVTVEAVETAPPSYPTPYASPYPTPYRTPYTSPYPTPAPDVVSLTWNKNAYTLGSSEQILIGWRLPSGRSAGPKDWIGISPSGEKWEEGDPWFYINGRNSGSQYVRLPYTHGSYEVIYYLNDGFTELHRKGTITITPRNVSSSRGWPTHSYLAAAGFLSFPGSSARIAQLGGQGGKNADGPGGGSRSGGGSSSSGGGGGGGGVTGGSGSDRIQQGSARTTGGSAVRQGSQRSSYSSPGPANRGYGNQATVQANRDSSRPVNTAADRARQQGGGGTNAQSTPQTNTPSVPRAQVNVIDQVVGSGTFTSSGMNPAERERLARQGIYTVGEALALNRAGKGQIVTPERVVRNDGTRVSQNEYNRLNEILDRNGSNFNDPTFRSALNEVARSTGGSRPSAGSAPSVPTTNTVPQSAEEALARLRSKCVQCANELEALIASNQDVRNFLNAAYGPGKLSVVDQTTGTLTSTVTDAELAAAVGNKQRADAALRAIMNTVVDRYSTQELGNFLDRLSKQPNVAVHVNQPGNIKPVPAQVALLGLYVESNPTRRAAIERAFEDLDARGKDTLRGIVEFIAGEEVANAIYGGPFDERVIITEAVNFLTGLAGAPVGLPDFVGIAKEIEENKRAWPGVILDSQGNPIMVLNMMAFEGSEFMLSTIASAAAGATGIPFAGDIVGEVIGVAFDAINQAHEEAIDNAVAIGHAVKVVNWTPGSGVGVNILAFDKNGNLTVSNLPHGLSPIALERAWKEGRFGPPAKPGEVMFARLDYNEPEKGQATTVRVERVTQLTPQDEAVLGISHGPVSNFGRYAQQAAVILAQTSQNTGSLPSGSYRKYTIVYHAPGRDIPFNVYRPAVQASASPGAIAEVVVNGRTYFISSLADLSQIEGADNTLLQYLKDLLSGNVSLDAILSGSQTVDTYTSPYSYPTPYVSPKPIIPDPPSVNPLFTKPGSSPTQFGAPATTTYATPYATPSATSSYTTPYATPYATPQISTRKTVASSVYTMDCKPLQPIVTFQSYGFGFSGPCTHVYSIDGKEVGRVGQSACGSQVFFEWDGGAPGASYNYTVTIEDIVSSGSFTTLNCPNF